MIIGFHRRRLYQGLTRLDLLGTAAGFLALFLVVIASVCMAGEKRRIWVCASHLKTLGQAFVDYAHDHNDELPPAVLESRTVITSWDIEIAPYLAPKLSKQISAEEWKNCQEKVAPIFKCPSDREPRAGAQPRSYSMPIYDLKKASWPPDEQSTEGLGLYLEAKAVKQFRVTDAAEVELPVIKTSMVKAPADTALLVERISILNALWAPKFACIASVGEQFDAKTFGARDFHRGKMNYLMLDGHVELLQPSQSGGHLGTGKQGVWTIRPGD